MCNYKNSLENLSAEIVPALIRRISEICDLLVDVDTAKLRSFDKLRRELWHKLRNFQEQSQLSIKSFCTLVSLANAYPEMCIDYVNILIENLLIRMNSNGLDEVDRGILCTGALQLLEISTRDETTTTIAR